VTGTAVTQADTGTVTSAMIANGTIVDADVSASAAIATSKVSGLDIALANKVTSVTAADSTITVGGTSTAPTVKVGTVPVAQVSGLAASATTNTTNASNITSGTLLNALLVSVPDSALSTISTAGKVANSATTATNANTASTIVARDASGNFTAGTITAALTGNVTGNVSGTSGSTTGNAATVTNGVYTTDIGTVTSTMILDGTIVNADINASAAVASSKLNTQRSPSSPVGSIEPIPRYFAAGSPGARNNGYILFSGFYADKNYSISTSSTALFGVTGTAAVAGTGSGFITRVVLMSVSGGTYSVIARTGNITAYYASGATTTTSLPTAGLLSVGTVVYTGTFDGTATLTEGSFYTVGIMQYASTLGSATFASPLSAASLSGAYSAAGNPGLLFGQYQPGSAADVTTSTTFTSPAVNASAPWVRITP
jgi:hypothetical protein